MENRHHMGWLISVQEMVVKPAANEWVWLGMQVYLNTCEALAPRLKDMCNVILYVQGPFKTETQKVDNNESVYSSVIIASTSPLHHI